MHCDANAKDAAVTTDVKVNVMPSGVCLVMIVKNESAVIERCLNSVLPHVAAWCIADTGSTDDTKARIAAVAAAHGKAAPDVGKIVDAPWVDFGTNRTAALAAARAHAPFCAWQLMLDADDDVVWSADATEALARGCTNGNTEGFRVKVEFASGMTQFRTHVFATRLPWVYCGVLHEFPTLCLPVLNAVHDDSTSETNAEAPAPAPSTSTRTPTPVTSTYTLVSPNRLASLPGVVIRARTEGARSQNPHKYRDDALLLERELAHHPDDTRALFYCAQSWRDAGNAQRAVELYCRVAASPACWVEERYIACLNVVRLCTDPAVVQKHAFLATTFNSQRREVTTAWLTRTRLEGSTWSTEMLALGNHTLTTTPDVPSEAWLFVDPDVYAWRAGDEVALCAFYNGHTALACKFWTRILPRVPVAHRERIFNSIRFCGVQVPEA